MPESQLCPNCRGMHEPGACLWLKEAGTIKDNKEIGNSTPEEELEFDRFTLDEESKISFDLNKPETAFAAQRRLEGYLSSYKLNLDEAGHLLHWIEEKNFILNVGSTCRKLVKKHLSCGWFENFNTLLSWVKAKNIPLNLSESEISVACQEGFESVLSYGLFPDKFIDWIKEKKIVIDFNKPEVATACQKGVEHWLSESWMGLGQANYLLDWAKEKDITLDLNDPKITVACQKGLENNLSSSYIDSADDVLAWAKEKDITLDLNDPKITVACQKGLENKISQGEVKEADSVLAWAKEKGIALDMTRPEVAAACYKSLEYYLSHHDLILDPVEKILTWAREKNIVLNLNSQEIVLACQKRLEDYLSDANLDYNKIIDAFFVLTAEKKIIFDIDSICQKVFKKHLSQGDIKKADSVLTWAGKKGIMLDLNDPEITDVCQKGLENIFSHEWSYRVGDIFHFIKKHSIVLDVASACQKGLENCLSQGAIDDVRHLLSFATKEKISLYLKKPEITTVCQQGLKKCLSEGRIDSVKQIISFAEKENIILDFSKSEIASGFQKGLEACLSDGRIDNVQWIISFAEQKGIALDFSIPEVASACQKGLEACLSDGRIDKVQWIISFAEQKGIVLDIASACHRRIESCLLNKNTERAQEINQCFLHLSPEKAFALYSHHLQELLSVLEKRAPQLVSQCQKSIELFFSLFVFRNNPERLVQTLEANPFLSQALEANPRFGPKLVLKYLEFDKVSQAKIQFLFESKKAILKNNPNLDPESLEFRQAMQANLLDIDRNREIVGELAKAGVDTEKWLNYEETEYFNLKSGEELVPFSERVHTPLDRLGQTISSYTYQTKSVLSEWRDDLLKLEIEPASVEEDRARIKQMESELEKAKVAEDDKKAYGLGRGLEGMRKKMEQAKKIPLWNRLMSEIDNFAKLKQSLVKSQEDLILLEQKYEAPATAGAKSPSGVELSKLKSKIAQAKEDFRKRLGQLERRLETFRADFPVLIAGLGQERALSLEQELNEKMAEQFTHYDSDRQTLESLFSESADKEKEKLEDRPMSVFVWARNPDIDLYQGNYSPCCICIESTHMGAESTIADYATDLGIQVVNVWDEQKNEPVVAAWCWLGRDENGKTALVVDNIEANTLYSSSFPAELWQELHTYFASYAQAIGANHLVLGKANNDLPTAPELAKLPEAEAKYEKIGGQNSRPNGYFLEAEGQSVKLIWEKVVREVKAEERPPKIELKNLKIQELTGKDFAEIIKLERQIYEEEGLVRGQEMINDLKDKEGLNYSVALYGKRPKQEKEELLGYLVAFKDKTDEGEPCVYLEDIAIAPDCQGHGLGWQLIQKSAECLKMEAKKQSKSLLWDMHLRPDSQRLFEKHKEDLEKMGITLVESALVPNYYDEGEDALYCVYEVRSD